MHSDEGEFRLVTTIGAIRFNTDKSGQCIGINNWYMVLRMHEQVAA
jgi:hypothetical protein